MKKRVYLSGPMEYVPDGGVGWREEITPKLETLGLAVINPYKLNNLIMKEGDLEKFPGWKLEEPERYDAMVASMASLDLAAARGCDYTVVKVDKYINTGAGTHCEISTAWQNKRTVIYWIDGVERKDIPGFLLGLYHHIVYSEKELLDYLKKDMEEPS